MYDETGFSMYVHKHFRSIFQDNHSSFHLLSLADVDECSQDSPPCDVNANCTNIEASYICQCNEGYEGDGVNCTGNSKCRALKFEVCTTTQVTSYHKRTIIAWR